LNTFSRRLIAGQAWEENVNSERYAGKPLLAVLEAYVLWSIDELPLAKADGLNAMAPKLAELFGGNGTWQSAVETTMELPANMPQLIQERWRHNLGIAAQAGVELAPQQFAEMFVDANLT
jgi:hypothetical protein